MDPYLITPIGEQLSNFSCLFPLRNEQPSSYSIAHDGNNPPINNDNIVDNPSISYSSLLLFINIYSSYSSIMKFL